MARALKVSPPLLLESCTTSSSLFLPFPVSCHEIDPLRAPAPSIYFSTAFTLGAFRFNKRDLDKIYLWSASYSRAEIVYLTALRRIGSTAVFGNFGLDPALGRETAADSGISRADSVGSLDGPASDAIASSQLGAMKVALCLASMMTMMRRHRRSCQAGYRRRNRQLYSLVSMSYSLTRLRPVGHSLNFAGYG